MAYVSFEQAPGMPEGAGYFQTDMGQKTPLVYLPQEAARLAPPDLRTASAADMLPPSVGAALAGGAPPALPPSRSDASGPMIPPGAKLSFGTGTQSAAAPPPPPTGTLDRIAAATGITPPPTPSNPPPAPPRLGAAPPATGGGPGMGETPSNDAALARAFVAPGAGGGGGGTSHFAKSLTHEALPSLSPEQLAAMTKAQQDSADVAAENLKRESDTQTHLAVNKSFEAQIARDDREQARQREVAARDQQAAWDGQWQAAMKEDPTDVFHGNVMAHALSILGQAMGAYGASITHSENWAAKAYEKLVDNNVRVQMAKRQGLYQRMRDAGADAEQAANAVKAASYEVIARNAEQQAAQAKSDQARGQATQVAVDVRKLQQGVVNENALAEQGKTSVTTQTSGSTGGGGGGDRIAEMVKRREQWVKLGRDPADFDKAAGFAEGKGQDNAQTAAEARLKIPAKNALNTINEFAPKMGLRVDPKTGEWLPQSLSGRAWASVPGTEAHNASEAGIGALAAEITKLRTGGTGTEADREAVEKELRTYSPQRLAMTLNQVAKTAQGILGTKIFHGKNQVPGGDDGEGQ